MEGYYLVLFYIKTKKRYKKVILSAIIIAIFSLTIFSQTTVKVAFGINNSHLNTDVGDWSNQARIGYQMGGSWLFGRPSVAFITSVD